MRARSREINIFNMSLLDILCGALGAFCFMMLVLLPYYKPPGKETDLHQQEVKTQDLLDELEKLRARAQDSALAQQMANLVQQLQEQLKQMQGQLNQTAAENEQLKAENQNLAAQKQELTKRLGVLHPFLTVVGTFPPQSIDLYLQDDIVTTEKKSNPPFDLSLTRQHTYWPGDMYVWTGGSASWVVRDSPSNVHYKLYVKLAGEPAVRVPTSVDGIVEGYAADNKTWWDVKLPSVELTPQRFWALMGTLTADADGKISFKVATQEERDAEWSKLSKSYPPPQVRPTATAGSAMPFPVQTAQPSSTPLSPEQRRALLEKIEKQGREGQQQQTPAGASPSQSP